MGFFLFFTYANGSGLLEKNPFIIILDILYWTLIGPLLFIYFDLITSGSKKLKLKHLFHLLPTIIVLLGFYPYFFQDEVLSFFRYNPGTRMYTISTYVWYYNSPLYYLICVFLLYRHKKKIKLYYSYTKNVDLKWLFYLVHGFAAFLVFGFISGLLRNYFNIVLPFGSHHYTWLVMIVYIFGMGYYGFRQKGLFFNTTQNDKNDVDRNLIKIKSTPNYKKSNLNDSEAVELEYRLRKEMDVEKPYLDCELDLRVLALKLQTSPHKLSQLINERMQCNFYEFVNEYRVSEVKKALIDPKNQNLKIMAVAYDSGFNSKSSFYNTFNKYTGINPSKYKEQYSA